MARVKRGVTAGRRHKKVLGKAKVTLRFRGREMVHQDIGRKLLDRVQADLAATAIVEQFPMMEGRQMVMVFSPKKK